MPPRTALSTSLRGWRCPQCAHRTISTTSRLQAFGPEHPRYIDVPEPPQQTLPYHRPIKGSLPVPRNVFPGQDGVKKAFNKSIALKTQRPKKVPQVVEGSREEWKLKMSEARRRNLEEGLKALRGRSERFRRREKDEERRVVEEKVRLRAEPEREDERLTTPSHGLDLEKLMRGPLPDPTRAARLQHKARNLEIKTRAKQAERLDHLHTLYMHARTFIVNSTQLDAAIEEEFTNKTFDLPGGYAMPGVGGMYGSSGNSMWNFGAPMTVQDMLNRAGGKGGGAGQGLGNLAVGGEGGMVSEVNAERVRRVAEKLTGGKMD